MSSNVSTNTESISKLESQVNKNTKDIESNTKRIDSTYETLTDLIEEDAAKIQQNYADIQNLESSLRNKADLVDGKVPESQLPSYVDDVVEYVKEVNGDSWRDLAVEVPIGELVWCAASSSNAGPFYRKFARNTNGLWTGLVAVDPEVSKIYVNTTNNQTYRWSGSNLIEISKSLAIGETASTAFAGNRGKKLEEELAKL